MHVPFPLFSATSLVDMLRIRALTMRKARNHDGALNPFVLNLLVAHLLL
jgi:hypothetical protein